MGVLIEIAGLVGAVALYLLIQGSDRIKKAVKDLSDSSENKDAEAGES